MNISLGVRPDVMHMMSRSISCFQATWRTIMFYLLRAGSANIYWITTGESRAISHTNDTQKQASWWQRWIKQMSLGWERRLEIQRWQRTKRRQQETHRAERESAPKGGGGGGTLGISGWECAAGTLEPLTYTRASSAEFCYPILE